MPSLLTLKSVETSDSKDLNNPSEKEPAGYNDDDYYSSSSKKIECNDGYHHAGVEVLEQIKEKFHNSTSSSEKLLLLTLAPKS